MNFKHGDSAARLLANERNEMSDRNRRNPENVPGPLYVDDTCIDCDLCRSTAPQFFRRSDAGQYSYVFRQPGSPEEWSRAMEAMQDCPTDTIGNDGDDGGEGTDAGKEGPG